MAFDAASPEYPRLTLIDSRLTVNALRDEAHLEAVAFCDDAMADAAEIINTVTGLLVPSPHVINLANRIAYRAEMAKAELLALTGAMFPDGAA